MGDSHTLPLYMATPSEILFIGNGLKITEFEEFYKHNSPNINITYKENNCSVISRLFSCTR